MVEFLTCSCLVQVMFAQQAGAIAAIVYDDNYEVSITSLSALEPGPEPYSHARLQACLDLQPMCALRAPRS